MLPDMTIDEFIDYHNITSHINFEMINYDSLTECWDYIRVSQLPWLATRAGVLNDDELRAYTVYCCKIIYNILSDNRSIKAIDTVERITNDYMANQHMTCLRMSKSEILTKSITKFRDFDNIQVDARMAEREAINADAPTEKWNTQWLAARIAFRATTTIQPTEWNETVCQSAYEVSWATPTVMGYDLRDTINAHSLPIDHIGAIKTLETKIELKQANWLRANTHPNFKKLSDKPKQLFN
jgi:hypothetical protein